MFNATVPGQPYNRVMRVIIEYTAPNTAAVTTVTQEHVPLTDGTHEALRSANELKFPITETELATSVPLLNITTGEPLGRDMPVMDVLLGINAVIRARQVA